MNAWCKCIACIVLFLMPSCEYLSQVPFDDNHQVTVTNLSPCHLRVSLDGEEEVLLRVTEAFVFENLARGYHVFQAFLDENGISGEMVAEFAIQITNHEDYSWVIRSCRDGAGESS